MKKVRVLLPALAFMFAIATAFTTVNAKDEMPNPTGWNYTYNGSTYTIISGATNFSDCVAGGTSTTCTFGASVTAYSSATDHDSDNTTAPILGSLMKRP